MLPKETSRCSLAATPNHVFSFLGCVPCVCVQEEANWLLQYDPPGDVGDVERNLFITCAAPGCTP